VEVPADRFGREIVGFLAGFAMRLRQLNGNSLGGLDSPELHKQNK
jgi:hypothetical protein